jgi:hypothetical protein
VERDAAVINCLKLCDHRSTDYKDSRLPEYLQAQRKKWLATSILCQTESSGELVQLC